MIFHYITPNFPTMFGIEFSLTFKVPGNIKPTGAAELPRLPARMLKWKKMRRACILVAHVTRWCESTCDFRDFDRFFGVS